MRLRKIEHHFFRPTQIAGGLAVFHRVVDGFHVRVCFLIEQLKEEAEIPRIAFVRSRGEKRKVRCLLAKQFAESVALALVLSIASRHAMSFVDDDQVPIFRLTHAWQNFVTLRQIHRSDYLRVIVPEVDAVLNAKIAAAEDAENLLKSIGHFPLPLKCEVRRTDD